MTQDGFAIRDSRSRDDPATLPLLVRVQNVKGNRYSSVGEKLSQGSHIYAELQSCCPPVPRL